MKILKRISVYILTLFMLSGNVSAIEPTQRINWCFRTQGKGEQPQILGGSDIPEKYDILYMGEKGDKTVYLTFDAGYSNENVEKILDVLNAQEVKGAFFILPGIIKNSPEVVKRMANEGHLVCNHTTTHCDISKITNIKALNDELTEVAALYKMTTGKDMERFFRPPEGAFSVRTLEFCQEMGYIPVFWSFAYADWDNNKQPNPEASKEKILNAAHDGMVILLHPTSKTNADILDSVITELKSQGYRFGTLTELAEKQGL